MDKGVEGSRSSLQIKQSGHKRLFHASDKSKKGRVKSLSAVGSISKEEVKEKKKREMAIHVFPGSQRQEVDEGREKNLLSLSKVASSTADCNGNSSKKVKISIKLSDDPAGDYCSTVPRKLRTAIRKRNKESNAPRFPSSKKKINGIGRSFESFENECGKRSKSTMRKGNVDCRSSTSSYEFLSKDEEEVAETLSFLADMVDKRQSQVKDLCISAATSSDGCRVSTLGTKAICKEPKECQLKQAELRIESSVNAIPDYFSKHGVADFAGSTQLDRKSDTFRSRTHSNVECHLEEEQTSIKLEADRETKNVKPATSLGPSPLDVKPESGLLGKQPGLQLNLRHCETGIEKNGSWPASDAARRWTHIASSGSFDSKFPCWLDAALCTLKPGPLQNASTETGFNVYNPDRKSRKRCATHLHICRLIQNSQIRKRREQEKLNNGNGITCLNGIGSTNDNAALRKQVNETARFTRSPLASGNSSFKKRTFNFLSLSVDDEDIKTDVPSRAKDEVDPTRPHVLPIQRNQHILPSQFAVSQCYPSSALMRESPAPSASTLQSQLLQAAPYEQRQSSISHTDSGSSSAKPPYEVRQQEQQYYQSLWAAHVAAQFRPSGSYISPGQFQNGGVNSPLVPPYPATLPATDGTSSKTPTSQHQQRPLAISPSVSQARLQKRENCSSSYDASGHGFASSSMRMQLLCKDRL